MPMNTSHNGWNRIASHLDVEVEHGIPVRISNTDCKQYLDKQDISEKVYELTGLNITVHDLMHKHTDEQEWSVCIDKKEFKEVLRRLALSSAAMFVDRFHKAIDHSAVDWDHAEYNYDFNHAVEHCCIPYGSLNKYDYFKDYVKTMHEESIRLVNEGISPMVDAE